MKHKIALSFGASVLSTIICNSCVIVGMDQVEMDV